MKIGLCLLLLLVASATMLPQTQDAPVTTPAVSGDRPASEANASTTSIQPDLDRLSTVAAQAALDIEKLRIEKWKANSDAKSAAQANADSVRRNLTTALPVLIANVRSAPEDLNAEFKLYRNVNVLYDVFGTLTQATRSFGRQSEYEEMAQQLQVIGSVRRKLGDSLEQSTLQTQQEVKQMRTQIADQQQRLAAAEAAAAAPPPKTIVAAAEPPKKKKKTAPKKPAPASGTSNPASSGSNSSAPAASGATVPKS
jgi:hypothetical protein